MTEPHEGMSPAEFDAWLDRMGFSGREAARKLGLGVNTVPRYLREGAPLTTALACSALAAGLGPWRETVETVDWNERETLVSTAHAATSLAALYVALEAYEDWHSLARVLDDRVDEQEPDWSRLLKFGGERPETEDPVDVVYSWDEGAVLTRAKGSRNWCLSARA